MADATELGHLGQLLYGLMTSQAIHVAAKLGIADLVGEAPETVEELAEATKTDAASLQRVLRMLTSVGVFAEEANGGFRQTRLSVLSRQRPFPLGPGSRDPDRIPVFLEILGNWKRP